MKTMLDSVMKEIEIMKTLNHPNCVRLFEVSNHPGDNIRANGTSQKWTPPSNAT